VKSLATESLEADVRASLNAHNAENASDTPDFILASYLMAALGAFNVAVRARDRTSGIAAERRADVAKLDALIRTMSIELDDYREAHKRALEDREAVEAEMDKRLTDLAHANTMRIGEWARERTALCEIIGVDRDTTWVGLKDAAYRLRAERDEADGEHAIVQAHAQTLFDDLTALRLRVAQYADEIAGGPDRSSVMAKQIRALLVPVVSS